MKMVACVPAWRIAKWKAATFLFAIALGGCGLGGGTHVTIENGGSIPLESVVLHVTGNRYSLGDIPPNSSKSVDVKVEGESDIELSHANGNRFKVDVYLEPGYGGSVHATVTSDSVLTVKQDISVVGL